MTKNLFRKAIVCTMACLTLSGIAAASKDEPGDQSEEQEKPSPVIRWQGAKLNVVHGRIHDILIQEAVRGQKDFLQVTVATATGEVLIDVAPYWFLKSRGMTFAIGDDITASGLCYNVADQKTMVAAKIGRGSSNLLLRSPKGRPFWLPTARSHDKGEPDTHLGPAVGHT